MCGIIGYAGSADAAPILIDGLRRLEYRGYDSAGIVVVGEGELRIKRSIGKVDSLGRLVDQHPLRGKTGLGHTRWATHGKPSEENAHPHTDCAGKIVVVHNGIIENYLELKEYLLSRGHVFKSETDTEVIVHLLEEKIKNLGKDGRSARPHMQVPLFFEAVRLTVAEMSGAYALGILWTECPDTIIGVRKQSPLLVGLGNGASFLASDAPAFLDHTRDVIFLDDGEIVVMTAKNVKIFGFDGKKIEKRPVAIQWDSNMAQKGGYRHFMLKEIYEQQQAVEDTLRGRVFPLDGSFLRQECALSPETVRELEAIQIVACGTAYHAGMAGKYMIERLAGLPVNVDIASEFRYRDFFAGPRTLLIAVSQSGETADTLAAVKEAKKRGARTLAVCNVLGSSLTRETDAALYTRCGPEIGVASTKAFSGQLAALYLLALQLAVVRKKVDAPGARLLADEFLRIPALMGKTLEIDGAVEKLAHKLAGKGHYLFLGRNVNYPIALEGALKIKEISYVHAEGYAGGEMKHGPIAIIDDGMPVIAIATASKVYDKMLSNIEEARARGAFSAAIMNEGHAVVKAKLDAVLEVPRVSELLSPLINVIPLQLFAYHVAVARKCDVDQPRNLAKSVTVE